MANQKVVDGVETPLEEESYSKMDDSENDLREMTFNNGDMVDLKGDGNFNEVLGVATPNDQIAEDIEDRKSPSPFDIDCPKPEPE